MHITCPNCTSGFELPTELLGRKGRALKCASCGHSWYQTAQVESMDLASIMGEEYATKAQAAAGIPRMRSAVSAAAAGRSAAVPGSMARMAAAAPPPARPPLPGGAVSMMGGGKPSMAAGARNAPGAQAASGGQRPNPVTAALSGQSMRGQAGAGTGTVGAQAALSLMHSKGGGSAVPNAVGAPAQPMSGGTLGGPTAAPLSGQSMRGQAGASGPGQAPTSWMQNNQAAAGPGAPAQPMQGGALGGPTAVKSHPNVTPFSRPIPTPLAGWNRGLSP